MTSKESAQELLAFHKSLVSISCITENESPCTEFLQAHLTKLGYTVELQTISPGRENVLAYLGKGRNPKVLFNTHIDVVPPYIEYREDDENVYGRGSSDAKGSMAAQVQAVEELRREGKVAEGDIGFLFVVGEEVDHIGMVVKSQPSSCYLCFSFGMHIQRECCDPESDTSYLYRKRTI